MPEVTIIGAGMAGLTAALRLAQLGYKVTVFERDSFVGGKFRATKWEGLATKRTAFHEHSYHMFLNWYHNFWKIAREIGAIGKFRPMTSVKFLHQGEFPRMKELVNFGSPASIPQNLLSGVLPLPDMFLYMYSVVDLLSTPMQHETYRDLISVNAFAATKLYSTERSVSMYDEYLAKTFAVASYDTSAKTFQTFLEFGTFSPEPLYWALEGDCFTRFLAPLETMLTRQLGVRIVFNHEAIGITLGPDGNASEVTFKRLPESYSPSLSEILPEDALLRPQYADQTAPIYSHKVHGTLIVAVPHASLSQLLTPDILNRDPKLGEGAKLESVPMASVHLHLKETFAHRLKSQGIQLPAEPVVLVDSKYKLSFVDNSRLWGEHRDVYLNVVASDSRPLNNLEPPAKFTTDRSLESAELGLSLGAPRTTLDHILQEFRQFVPFEDDDIDVELLQIDRNVGRELFINDVGSWQWRPDTQTKVKNLFLAGDYCKTFIEVVSLEGAVVSGLQAAECVRQQSGVGVPIEIARPGTYPYPLFWPLKVALAPYAAWAKMWCMCADMIGGPVEAGTAAPVAATQPGQCPDPLSSLLKLALTPYANWAKAFGDAVKALEGSATGAPTERARPQPASSPLDLALAPYAAWAKMWSVFGDALRGRAR